MKKGAILDMDGLMFDTERLFRESWRAVAEAWGQELSPDFCHEISGTSGEGTRAVVRKYYPAVDTEEFIAACVERVIEIEQTFVPQKPGLLEFLKFLRENGIKTAVASSSSLSMIQNNLRVAGVESWFDVVVCGEQVVHGKPAPDIFLLAAEQLGLSPEDCYVLEDSINGIRAGAAAGCAAIMIPDMTAPTEEVRALATAILPSLHALAEAIRNGIV